MAARLFLFPYGCSLQEGQRVVMAAYSELLLHELGEALRHDGQLVADPHQWRERVPRDGQLREV